MKVYNFNSLPKNLDFSESIFIHPTCACYGMGASIYDEESYFRIYDIKWRPVDKPFFITVKDLLMLKEIWIYDPRVEQYLYDYPNTKFTFILKRWKNIPHYVNPWYDNIWVQIAVGVPQFIFSHINTPVFWTSANISNMSPIYDFKDIEKVFWSFTDIIWINAGILPYNPPSTIIDLTSAEPKILRWALK